MRLRSARAAVASTPDTTKPAGALEAMPAIRTDAPPAAATTVLSEDGRASPAPRAATAGNVMAIGAMAARAPPVAARVASAPVVTPDPRRRRRADIHAAQLRAQQIIRASTARWAPPSPGRSCWDTPHRTEPSPPARATVRSRSPILALPLK